MDENSRECQNVQFRKHEKEEKQQQKKIENLFLTTFEL
jgi:hypothetical protein